MSLIQQLAARAGFRNPLKFDRTRRQDLGAHPQRLRAIPSTEQGWQERYNWLWDWYTGMPYGEQDVQFLRLFKAVDMSGETMALAERLSRDAQFVVDTDVHALAGGRWSLEATRDGSAGAVTEGEGVWRRSQLQAKRAAWMRTTCALGDLWLEAVRTEHGPRIVAYDPRHCVPEYTADGIDVKRLDVRIPYYDASGTPRVYERSITATSITASELDPRADTGRVEIPGQTGSHGLGVAPVVHLRCQPIVGIHEHSLWSGHGLDRYTAAVDSIIAQGRAIAHRYAHPHLVVKGVDLEDDSEHGGLEAFGRIYNGLPVDADLSYLEAGMGAIQPIRELLNQYVSDVRATIPEFTLSGSGANTTGRALEFRADQFRRKVNDLATRTHEPVALVTQYAVEMARDQAHDRSRRMFRIGAPPPLPIDQASRLSMVIQAHGAGLIKDADAVRQMQQLGLLDEELDAKAYANELQGSSAPATSVQPPPALDNPEAPETPDRNVDAQEDEG